MVNQTEPNVVRVDLLDAGGVVGVGYLPAPSEPRSGLAPAGRGRSPRRQSERGATIFIVVMVLTLLTAIGIFAVRASSMGISTSGYDRQNTQNHYVGEYGMLGAVTELSTTKRSAYVMKMSNSGDNCWAAKNVAPGVGVPVPCYRIYAHDVQNSLASGRLLFEPSSADGGTLVTPGSLGPAPLEGDFVVEMTDPGPVGMPVAGTDVGGTGPRFRYLQVTLTSIGQVRPSGDPACADPALGVASNAAALSGNETGRAFIVVGPMPQ